MNEIQIFNNSEFGEIRTLTIDNEPYFVGKDVAVILGYAKPENAIANHVDKDDTLKQGVIDSLGRTQQTTIINESGLYSLILSSKLPTAKKFKRWVTSEVLPTIRKTGSYTTPNAVDKTKALEVKEMNARVRMANMLLKLAKVDTLSPDYKNILVAKSAEVLTGEALLPLPKSEQKTYSAGDIAGMFGVSAQKIGHIAKANNMKTDEYGCWYKDKSPYSPKEVDTFRYNDKAVEKFREIFK
ncbi:MAG: Bro-N domain-containing protein [Ruminococcus sp.]|nr:Bro-N domain-containing protein [Ruminococcus sp.]